MTDTGRRAPNKEIIILAGDSEKFWERVHVGNGDECWEWALKADSNGYGDYRLGPGRRYKTHRIAFFLGHGKDPGELLVCHACDNPTCCNPAHLWIGTPRDNILDCHSKGRNADVTGENNGTASMTDATAKGILEDLVAKEMKVKDIALKWGVHRARVTEIKMGKVWTCVVLSPEKEKIREKLRNSWGQAKLTKEDIAQAIEMRKSGMLCREIAEVFGVCMSTIARAVRNKRSCPK